MKQRGELLQELIDEKRKEVVKSEVYINYFSAELRNPKEYGKSEALENKQTWKRHKERTEAGIELLEKYGKGK